MKRWRQYLASGSFASALWVGLCFALASALYMSWLLRLVTVVGGTATDWASMVAGYLFQAAGMGVAMHRLRLSKENRRRDALLSVALLVTVSVPAILTDNPAAALLFGWLMNLLCGFLGGCYLYAVAVVAPANRRGLAFGGGYGAATVAVGLLALAGDGALTRGYGALASGLLLAIPAAWAAWRLPLFETPAATASSPKGMPVPDGRGVAATCAVVVLISAVKNLGFSFPSADIGAGLVPQLSRLPYALGLMAAGVIVDKSRKNGMICTLAALLLPFVMLGLINEPLPSTLFWGLDYLFYGFFSVFRVVLMMDVAERLGRWELAPLGLVMGRVGDAAGTAVALALAGRQVALVAVAAVGFVCSVFLLLRRFQKLYEPEVERQRNEQEVFESFCLRSDLSAREREVLRMLLAGHSNANIAQALFITENTVKYHVRNVLQKTGCKNRVELQKQFTLALYPNLDET